jgi:uncharacterized membrane protein
MSTSSTTKRNYIIAISLFSALFIGSVLLSVIDTKGSYDQFEQLTFPSWLLYPLALAKTIGVITILKSKSNRLKDFAYAGFLFDLLLALGAHISEKELYVLMPIFGIIIWAFAYTSDRKYYDSKNEKVKEITKS